MSLLAFVVQTTVSTLALEKLGLGVTASTPSLALVAGGIGGLMLGLQGALMARAGESVLRSSLFKTGYEIFFTPIEPQDKRAAKSIIDVGFDRLGDAVGGAAVATLLLVPFGDPSRRLLLAAVAARWACSTRPEASAWQVRRNVATPGGAWAAISAMASSTMTPGPLGMCETSSLPGRREPHPERGRAE